MQAINTKALSLAWGISMAIMAGLALLLGSTLLAVIDLPAWAQATSVPAAIGIIIAAFIQGVIMGALVGWMYNGFGSADETDYAARMDRDERVSASAY